MGKILLSMTMSVDGFINDRNGSVESLFPDLLELGRTEILQELIKTTGAVLMGKRTYEMGDPDWYADHYEYQVPIFVLTHHVPEKMPRETKKLTFSFVTDGIESAIEKAKTAAGDKYVTVVGGANTTQQLIKGGLVDEIEIGLMPFLLGKGLRFFDHIGTEQIQLERIRVIESPTRIDIRFRVVK